MDYSKLLQCYNDNYENIGENGLHLNFECKDFFKLPKIDDVAIIEPEKRIKQYCSVDAERNSKIYWLMDSSTFSDVFVVDENGKITKQMATTLQINTALKCRVDVKSLLNLIKTNKTEYKNIIKYLNVDKKEHFLTFGECPQLQADKTTSEKLEKLFNNGNVLPPLKATGKHFTTNGNFNILKEKYSNKFLPEFKLGDEKFVRCVYFNKSNKIEIKWQKVSQIKWFIQNWEQSKKYLTKNTTSSIEDGAYIECVSELALIPNLPFNCNRTANNNLLWQNSTIRAFANSLNLKNADKDDNYLSATNYNFENDGFLHQSINFDNSYAVKYQITQEQPRLCHFAFCGNTFLEQINVPNTVKNIDYGAFDCLNENVKIVFSENQNITFEDNCFENAQFKYIYITQNGKNTILTKSLHPELQNSCYRVNYSFDILKSLLSDNYRKNFILMQNLQEHSYIKFIPPVYTLRDFPNEKIQNYFINRNYLRWQKLTKELRLYDIPSNNKEEGLSALLKIYYAIGGFSSNQGESEKAYNFLANHLYDHLDCYDNNSRYFLQSDLIKAYSELKLCGDYNKDFANFFMKNYQHEFLLKSSFDKYGAITEPIDYLPLIHNNFSQILKCLPNKKTTGHDIRTQLTPELLIKYCNCYTYDNEEEQNKLLADTIRPYGYTQSTFEEMQKLLLVAEQIKDKCTIICDKDNSNNKIMYRMLEKDDVKSFIIGDILNSCFKMTKTGEACLKDALTNPDAAIVLFEDKETPSFPENVIAASYLWYNKEKGLVCFDNIDIPLTKKILLDKFRDNYLSENDLFTAIESCANSIYTKMNETQNKVQSITIGLGHSYFYSELKHQYPLISKEMTTSHGMYRGYSDADKEQVSIISNIK